MYTCRVLSNDKNLLTLFLDLFRYDPHKGFFCQVVNGDHTKCLGKSKGRHYSAMDPQSCKYLQVCFSSKFLFRLLEAYVFIFSLSVFFYSPST